MRVWRSLLGRDGGSVSTAEPEKRFHPYELFSFGGISYTADREFTGPDFVSNVQHAYKSSGVVFACMLARQLVFSEAKFLWQRFDQGRPGDLFGTPELAILERPWPNGTTGELLSRMLQDTDLAGNAYVVKQGNRLRRLRPDWVEIVLTAPPSEAVASDVVGYRYRPGGRGQSTEGVMFTPEEVVHWAPIPDPEAQYRGMSWLTPVLREIESDRAATLHKKKFFDNGATPNLAVSLSPEVTREQFREFTEEMDSHHKGVHNAYKTLYLGGGADVKTVGADMRQLDFKATQGAGETRIAAAARVHPVVVGLSEGMQGSSLNAGNFNSARRNFADGTLRPLWRDVAGALESVLTVPAGARLWFDTRDIEFLQEDRSDAAEIQQKQAFAIRQLTDAGFDPSTVVAAVQSDNMGLLDHTGVFSVQLQPPDTGRIDSVGEGDSDGGSDSAA